MEPTPSRSLKHKVFTELLSSNPDLKKQIFIELTVRLARETGENLVLIRLPPKAEDSRLAEICCAVRDYSGADIGKCLLALAQGMIDGDGIPISNLHGTTVPGSPPT